MVTVLIRSAALIRGEALISMWAPKRAALIRGWRLFEARRLLEKIWYANLCIEAATGGGLQKKVFLKIS